METKRPLNPFEYWMVDQNLRYIKEEGLQAVVTRLRIQGYSRVADAVELIAQQDKKEYKHERRR